jgi:hypothetical protein
MTFSDRPNRSKSIKSCSNEEIDVINQAYDLQYEHTKTVDKTKNN